MEDIKDNSHIHDQIEVNNLKLKFIVVRKSSWFHIKGTWSVLSHSIETIYLSLSAHVAVGTFFMKFPVIKQGFCFKSFENHLFLYKYVHKD